MNESIIWALEYSVYLHTKIVESPAQTKENREISREAIRACQDRIQALSE